MKHDSRKKRLEKQARETCGDSVSFCIIYSDDYEGNLSGGCRISHLERDAEGYFIRTSPPPVEGRRVEYMFNLSGEKVRFKAADEP